MTDRQAASDFKSKFLARTAKARERAGFTQEAMADALGIRQSKYHKYESRSLLPHSLVLQFCTLCRITPEWLYSAAIEVKAPKQDSKEKTGRRKVA